MPQKTRLDIGSSNFDLYFAHEFKNKITPQGKEELPKDIAFKIFRKGDEFNPKNTSKLNFIERIFVLWKAIKKRWFLVIEDEEHGISIDEYLKLKEEMRHRNYDLKAVETFSESGGLVLASKELGDYLSYLNYLSNSNAYNYFIKAKNNFPPIPNKASEYRNRMMYIVNFLISYESKKKTWVAEHGITIPEWFVLLSLYHGNEVVGSPIHKEVFKRSYQSSPAKLKSAFGTLQLKGYIQKTGERSGAKLRITALGIDLLNNILNKYCLNF